MQEKTQTQIQSNVDIVKRMTSKYEKYLSTYKQGGDWDIYEFMSSIHDKVEQIEQSMKDDEKS